MKELLERIIPTWEEDVETVLVEFSEESLELLLAALRERCDRLRPKSDAWINTSCLIDHCALALEKLQEGA